jgi:hypothetical protein
MRNMNGNARIRAGIGGKHSALNIQHSTSKSGREAVRLGIQLSQLTLAATGEEMAPRRSTSGCFALRRFASGRGGRSDAESDAGGIGNQWLTRVASPGVTSVFAQALRRDKCVCLWWEGVSTRVSGAWFGFADGRRVWFACEQGSSSSEKSEPRDLVSYIFGGNERRFCQTKPFAG